ncbi:ABC transporter B family member 19 [Selaginella moellendorffii]|nr:ABC transporter B family member 19 [Selaginella moellendorffii]|eukprot:XP_002969904.2 ABC transporter B family member 19 [Selaginella moellendorffii]
MEGIEVSGNSRKEVASEKTAFDKKLERLDRTMEDNSISSEKKMEEEKQASIPLHKIFAFADGVDCAFMFGGTIGAVAHGLALPIFLLLFGKLLNSFGSLASDPQEMYRQVSKYSLYFVYLGIAILFASWAEVALWMQAGERQVSRMRIVYLEAMLKQDISYFDLEARTGDIVDNLSGNMLTIQEAIGEKMGGFLHFVSTFIGGFVVGFATVWQLGLVTLAILPVIAVVGGFYTKAITGIASKGQADTEPGNIVEEMTAQIRTVYSFVGETKALAAYTNALKKSLKLGYKGGAAKGFGVGGLYGTMFCAWALLLWYGGVLVRKGDATGGSVLSTIFAVLIGGISLGQASPSIGALAKARAATQTILKAINHKPTINTSSKGETLSIVEGHVDLQDVHFSYPSRPDIKVFEGFSLSIPAAKCVAIVGGSGSGKSTVVSLIERFYDPTSGRILVDGHDIRTLDLKWLRSQIGLVNQEPALFATTIRNNILYGKPSATREEIEDAAKAANAHSFISQLPHGYETQAGERGVQLSGGQKQRIAIARAILKNPSILLFDEATSALDAESEHVVQDALDKLMHGHTTVIIAHRLSTIQNADTIAVVQEGKIVELGTHDELSSRGDGGAYATLVHLQNMAREVARDERQSLKSQAGSTSMRRSSAEHSGLISFSRVRSFISRQSSTKSDGLVEGVELEAQEKKGSYFFRLLKLNAAEWPFLLLGSAAAVVAGLVNPVFAMIISSVLSIYYNPDKSYMKSEVQKYSIIFVCIGVSVGMIHSLLHYSFGVTGESLTKRIRELMFTAVTRFEVSWFDRDENGSSQIASKLSTNAGFVRATMGDRVAIILQNSSLLVSAFLIAFIVEWRIALVVTASLPLLVASGISEQMFLKGFAGNIEKAHERATKLTGEAVSNIRTVAAFNAEAKMVELVTDELEVPKRSSFVRGQIAGIGYGVGSFFLFASFGLGLWYAGLVVRDGKASFGNAIKAFLVLVITSNGIGESLGLSPDIVKGGQALKSVFAILDRKTEINPDDPSAETVKNMKGEIELRSVDFYYPTRPEVTIFKNLNLKVHIGQSLAIVGASGSGKSSVISLVERFYDPVAGKVLVDGKDIRLLNLRSYRRFVGLVQQEPALFATSIQENIRYGKEDATESEIIEAATAANAHNFISALPDGYKTSVGERGAQLSGGQKQRVAIARAVLKNPTILLLDEATSALDAESEHIVQEALDRLMRGRTTIVVAHRLSTIRNADKIAVIQDGTIVEQGSHWELVAKADGAYSHLIKLQQQHSPPS